MNLSWIKEHCEWVDDAQTFLVDQVPIQIFWHDPERPTVQLQPRTALVRVAPIILYLVSGVWVEDVVVNGTLKLKNLRTAQVLSEEQRVKLSKVLDHHQLNDTGTWRQAKGGISRWAGSDRKLPHNVYATSSGKFIGRRGKRKTAIMGSVEDVQLALENEQWV